MKVSQLRKIIKEAVNAEIDEMARTKGTGGGIKITPEGETMLKRAKATGTVPEGIRANHLAILKFLYQAKQSGKRVQKIDYADSIGVAQPQVNSLFNQLIEKGLVETEKYTSVSFGATGSPKPKTDISSLLGDLDFGDDEDLDLGDEG